MTESADIERLLRALRLAAGILSAYPDFEHQHPEDVFEMLLREAGRE